jgi:hypothetical protein
VFRAVRDRRHHRPVPPHSAADRQRRSLPLSLTRSLALSLHLRLSSALSWASARAPRPRGRRLTPSPLPRRAPLALAATFPLARTRVCSVGRGLLAAQPPPTQPMPRAVSLGYRSARALERKSEIDEGFPLRPTLCRTFCFL